MEIIGVVGMTCLTKKQGKHLDEHFERFKKLTKKYSIDDMLVAFDYTCVTYKINSEAQAVEFEEELLGELYWDMK